MDHFLSLLNLLKYCFCFLFWSFDHKACWILAPWPGIKPTSAVLEGEVLTTGPPGKSPNQFLSLRVVTSNQALLLLPVALAHLPNPSPKPQYLPLFLPLLHPHATFRFTFISTSLILSSTCSEAVSVFHHPLCWCLPVITCLLQPTCSSSVPTMP